MIVPTGEVAGSIYGFDLKESGTRAKLHQEIFIRQGEEISYDLNQCSNQEYRDKLKNLIKNYPYITYAYVVLAWCLKKIGDSSWKLETEYAKGILEKLLDIKPHVLTIDGYYFWLVRNVLESPIEEGKYWDRGELGEYIPKGMPY